MSETDRVSDADLRALMILAGALILGVLTMGVIAFIVVKGFGKPPGGTGFIVTAVMLIQTVAVILGVWIVNQARSRQTLQKDSNLLDIYRTNMIFRYAACEGGCVGLLVAYIIEQHDWTWAIVGGLLSMMLIMFPTRTKVEQWMETQEMLRQTAGAWS